MHFFEQHLTQVKPSDNIHPKTTTTPTHPFPWSGRSGLTKETGTLIVPLPLGINTSFLAQEGAWSGPRNLNI